MRTTRTPNTGLARALRSNSTDAERLLWSRLRDRQLLGYKFRRQYAIDRYVVDFACLERRLIIELDGGQHSEQIEQDEQRTRVLESRGYRVLRFWNNEVMAEFEGVWDVIADAVTAPHPSPLPETRPSP